jgi:hypothetical protein
MSLETTNQLGKACAIVQKLQLSHSRTFLKKEQVLYAIVNRMQQNQGENLKCIAVTVQQQYQNTAV